MIHRLFAVLALAASAWAQMPAGGIVVSGGGGGGGSFAATMNLCGGSIVDYNLGTVTSGSLSQPLNITVVNNCGSPFTFQVQTDVFSETMTNVTRHNFQMGVMRNYRDDCPGFNSGTGNTLAAGASCHWLLYLIGSNQATTRGGVFLTDASGNRISRVSAVATTVSPTDINRNPILPPNVVDNGDGTYSNHTYNPTYIGDGTCTGSVISTASALSTALSTAHQGDTICILQGSTLNGTFTLRDTGDPTASWIHIRISDVSGNVPAGVPAAGTMDNPNNPHAAIAANTIGGITFAFAKNAHHYWLGPGLEVTSTAGSDSVVPINTQPGAINPQTDTVANFPHDIAIERNWVHPAERGIFTLANGVFGINVLAKNMLIRDNWIQQYGIQEYQGIASCDVENLSILHNHIDATSENIMFGGCAPAIVGHHPKGIEIRDNDLTKQKVWNVYDSTYAGFKVTVKNLFETKHSEDLLYEGNRACNWWSGQGQASGSMLTGSGNQSGSDFDSYQREITIANNLWCNTGWWFSVISAGYIQPTQANYNILIRDNLVYGMGLPWEAPDGNDEAFAFGGGTWVMPQSSGVYTVATLPTGTYNWIGNIVDITDGTGPSDCTVGGGADIHRCKWNGTAWSASTSQGASERKSAWNLMVNHNTVMTPAAADFGKNEQTISSLAATSRGSHSSFACNITRFGTYGYFTYGDGGNLVGSDGDSWVTLGWPDVVSPTWKNGVVGTKVGNFNTNNWLFQADDTAAGFTNPATNDWSLQVTSPWHNTCADGKDLGANVALVNSRTSGMGTLPWTLHTITSISPTSGTKSGGVLLTINGTGFSANSAIYLGGPSTLYRKYISNYAFKPTVTFASSGTTVTATLPVANTFYVGDSITVSGSTGTNGTYTITTVPDSTHFTFTQTSPPATDSGTIVFTPLSSNVAGVECTPANTGSWTSTQIQCTTQAMPAGYGTGRPINLIVIEKGEWVPFQSYTLN